MTTNTAPVACTLSGGDYRGRVAWLADLNREALLSYRHEHLRLELVYDAQAAERVAELVERERECCGFLSFDLVMEGEKVRLVMRPNMPGRPLSRSLSSFIRGALLRGIAHVPQGAHRTSTLPPQVNELPGRPQRPGLLPPLLVGCVASCLSYFRPSLQPGLVQPSLHSQVRTGGHSRSRECCSSAGGVGSCGGGSGQVKRSGKEPCTRCWWQV